MLRDRARGIDPRGLEIGERADLDLGRGDVRARPATTRRSCTRSCDGWPSEVGDHLRREGLSARTVTAKLRYADFSIRSRSTSLEAGIDDPARIGELACALLDRGLRDRPGALRLVGVGVSGLSEYRQLSLDEPS